MIDAVGFEPHFVQHLAPVWHALPTEVRGRFTVSQELAPLAASLRLDATVMAPEAARRGDPPKARPGDGPVALVASIGDTKIGRRLGYRRFIRMEHGAGQSYGAAGGIAAQHPSYPGGIDNGDAVLFIVPNEHAAERWRRAYPSTPVAIVGSPRLDELPDREPGPVTIAAAFHWPLSLCPETMPASGEFMPALVELAKRYQVIGHGHPRWSAYGDRIRTLCKRAGIEYVASFDDVCRRADLLVFDNTSAGFEFAATGRPVVVLNARGYRRSARHGLRFWDAATVGPQVDATDSASTNAAALAAAVHRALQLRASDVAAREDALDRVYAHRSGAAQRAADAIASWASERAVA